MKTVTRLSLFAILSLVLFSCAKDEQVPYYGGNAEPTIVTSINSSVNQPFDAMLGTSAAVFQVGSTITLYLSTQTIHDAVSAVNFEVRDADTQESINTYICNPVTDFNMVPGYNPDNGDNVQYFYTTFSLDASFANKSIDIIAKVTGNNSTSQDVMFRAFSVIE